MPKEEKKRFSLLMEEKLLRKAHSIAEYHGQSLSKHISWVLRKEITAFEKKYGNLES